MTIKRNDLPAYFFNALILLFLLINYIVNCDYLLLAIYIAFIIWIIIKRREIFLKYFYFIFITSWTILSVFLIENTDMWLPNLQVNSKHTGALEPLLVTNALSFLLVINIDSYFEKQLSAIHTTISSRKKHNYKLVGIIAIFIILIFLMEISKNNYFSSGASNRFYYLTGTSAIALVYYGYLLFLIPILSIYAAQVNKKKYLIGFSLMYCAFLILIGVKFGGIFQVIYVLVLTYLLPNKKEFINEHYRKILLYAFIILGAFFLYAIFQSFWEKGTIGEALEMTKNRLSNGQGDVWWGIYSKYKGTLHINELKEELGAFHTEGLIQEQYNFGIYKLMNLIAPKFVVSAYGIQGARFAASTEASFYYYFGIIGCVFFKMILAIIMVILINLMIIACKCGKGISAVLYVWLLSHYTRIYTMSDFYLLASKSAWMCIILLILLDKFHYKLVGGKGLLS